MELFEQGGAAGAGEETKEQFTNTRKKKTHSGRSILPDTLPVEEIVIEPEGLILY